MQDLDDEAGAFESGPSEWLKMIEPGNYALRIAPAWSAEGKPARKLVNHQDPFNKPIKDGEDRVAPLCFNYLFSNEHIAKILIGLEKITQTDYERWKQYGCPLCILPKKLRDKGVDRREVGPYWPRTQFVFNVVLLDGPEDNAEETGRLYKWSVSKTIFDTIKTAYAMDKDLFNPETGRNLVIEAKNTKGASRRYGAPQFSADRTPIALSQGLYDLDTVLAKGVKNFAYMGELLKTNRTDFSQTDRMGDLYSILTK